MAQIRLEMGVEPDRVFDGELIADDSTEKRWCADCREPWRPELDYCPTCGSEQEDGSQRWSEFALYRHVDGRYVLYVVGRTLVYHHIRNSCGPQGARSGHPVAVSEVARDEHLGPDASPCRKCLPPELVDLATGSAVDCEVNRFTVDVCADPPEVLAVLRMPAGTSTRPYSAPAERLIEAAKAADPEFAAALRTVQRL